MTQTTTPTKIKAAGLPAFDYVEGQLRGEYNIHAHHVEHYAEMAKISTTVKGKAKWRHLHRLAQKLKDDTLAILYRYQERRSLRDLAAAFHEAQEERRSLIMWLADHPQEGLQHTARAYKEIDYFGQILNNILHHIKDANPGRPIASEAAYVLATLPR